MTGASVRLRGALPAEAGVLTELALRSKACWGYPPAFMEACRAELTVDPVSMNENGSRYTVAELDEAVVGFYGVQRLPAGGVPSGTRESGSVPGRHLPLFKIPVGAVGE